MDQPLRYGRAKFCNGSPAVSSYTLLAAQNVSCWLTPITKDNTRYLERIPHHVWLFCGFIPVNLKLDMEAISSICLMALLYL